METHLQVVLMIVVAMLASFMATIRFLLSRRRANAASEVGRNTLPYKD